MKVAVVILNWNGKKFLEDFLPSVIANTPSFAEIIIADNASTDDSITFIKAQYPQLRVIVNASNGGFSKGYNDALKLVDAAYYVLLNSDVEVTPGWIEPVIALMDADKTIAACQPKIKAFHNRQLFEYAGAAGGFIDKYAYPFCRGRMFDTLEENKGQYDDAREFFWATGAFMFLRAASYHRVHGLDEDFFAHMEEIDLCWRLKNLGYKIMYCPQSVVYHVGGGTLNKTSPRKTYLNFRNNLLLICKNHPPRFLALKLFFRMVLDGIAGLKFLAGGEVKHFNAVIKAHLHFYGMLSATLKKRKARKAEITSYTTTGVYKKSIIADYYLRGKKKFSQLNFK